MDRRKLFLAVAALVLVVLAAFGLATRDRGLGDNPDKVDVTDGETETAGTDDRQLQALCASIATATRLKQVAFEEAFRIRNADPTNLDRLAASSVVRMENPAVRSFEEGSDIVTCTGRFVLELPPGAERAFNGERRLTADIEYGVQAGAGGNVFRVNGAEPLIYRLAAFDLQNAPPASNTIGNEMEPAAGPLPVDGEAGELDETDEPLPPETAEPRPTPAPRPTSPTPDREAQPTRPRASSNPSFSCRSAGTRGEALVCGSDRLAAKDRAMSSLFYSALNDANPRQRRELRRTRDVFLAYRDRCRDEACVAQAYDGRMDEIRDIMAALE